MKETGRKNSRMILWRYVTMVDSLYQYYVRHLYYFWYMWYTRGAGIA
jgi:hypothetical protein